MSNHYSFLGTIVRHTDVYFRSRGYDRYVLHVAGVFVVSLAVASGLFWSHLHNVRATILTPLNNYRAKDFALIQKDGLWHVFAIYVCINQTPPCDTTAKGLMHLTSKDLSNWTEEGYVVPPGTAGAWDSTDIWAPSIIEKDGTYYMYYTGVKSNGSNILEQKIGLATSTDLYNWTKSPSNPVVDCATLSWAYWNAADIYDGAACRDPYVTWDNDQHQWVMTISGRSLNDVTPTVHPTTIGLATSDDLTTWRAYGNIPQTNGYTTESSHIFQHGSTWYLFWTDNCSGARCLKYSTATTPYSGYSTKSDFLPSSPTEYASEYYSIGGREYFANVSSSNIGLSFEELVWSGTPFSTQEISFGSVSGSIWTDANLDGTQAAGDSGINGVTLTLYQDNGDGLFSAATETSYGTTTTGDDPNTIGTQTGYYRFSNVIPGDYWVAIDPLNYSTGQALATYAPTNGSGVLLATVTDNQTVTGKNVGLGVYLTSWDLMSSGNFAMNGVTISAGRATVSATSPAVTWWDANYKYRKQLAVTAGTQAIITSDTITIPVDLQSLITAGKMQSTTADARVVYWNGSTNAQLDVDIISTAAVRVKAQAAISPSASDAGYYLYYGRPTAAIRPTNLANIYRYYSSFNAPDASTYGNWIESNSDTHWVISGNKWFYDQLLGNDRFSKDTTMTFALDEGVAIEATVNITAGNTGGLSLVRPETFADDMYWMNIDAGAQRTQFFRWLTGQIGTDAAATLSTGQPYVARLEYQYTSPLSHTLRSYLNQALVHSQSEADTGYDVWFDGGGYSSNLKSAQVGLSVFNGKPSFDDVKAWRLRDTSVTVGSETYVPTASLGTIQPQTAQSVSFSRLQYFSADTSTQNGTVHFVLSNNQGGSWLYWNGSAWMTSDSSMSQSNTATEIQTQALSFPEGDGQLLWRAILQDPGAAQPSLLRVAVTTNTAPTTPTIVSPADGQVVTHQPQLRFSASDVEHEGMQFVVEVDTASTFATDNRQQYSQTSSQFGWRGQDMSNRTMYTDGTEATLTVATPLSPGTWYWRVTAYDPQGANRPSALSATASFLVPIPVSISAVSVQPSKTSMVVSWTTNASSSSWVEYGTTNLYGAQSATTTGTSHEVTLSSLTVATKYHLRVIADAGNGRTIQTGDRLVATTGTVISKISVTTTKSSATIRWTTSDAATTKVQYGKRRTALSLTRTARGLTRSHQVTLSRLSRSTAYQYRVVSAGSSSTQSSVLTFVTKAK